MNAWKITITNKWRKKEIWIKMQLNGKWVHEWADISRAGRKYRLMRHTNKYANNKTIAIWNWNTEERSSSVWPRNKDEQCGEYATYAVIFLGSNIFVADFMVHKSGCEQKHAVIVLFCRFHRLRYGADVAIIFVMFQNAFSSFVFLFCILSNNLWHNSIFIKKN